MGEALPISGQIKNWQEIDGCATSECLFFELRFGIDPYPSKAKQKIARSRFKRSTDTMENNTKKESVNGKR